MAQPAARSPTHATRLAPSPTGALHLGNARTFLITWALARQRGWRIILRLEDLDGPRVKPGAIEGAIETLRRLGMDWDEGPIIQSHDPEPYRAAMRALARRGMVYPSELSRSEIEAAASAPQDNAPGEGAGEVRFPPELRPREFPRDFTDEAMNWRFATPERTVEFVDEFAGPKRARPCESIGDFVVWTKRAQPAYQLAVVVDDARQGMTHVVRGDDLLDSAARQLLLYEALGLGPIPAYTHLPLVVGADGRRLAKRHGDTRLDTYFARGVAPERIIALLARWCGVAPNDSPPFEMSAAEFRRAFDLARLPRERIVFTPEDDRWFKA